MELQAFFRQSNAATDAEVKRLRALRDQLLADRRLDLLLLLRDAGIPMATALEEVERAMPAASSASGADNDNGVRHEAPGNELVASSTQRVFLDFGLQRPQGS